MRPIFPTMWWWFWKYALIRDSHVQPFSQKSLSATVPKVFQIGLCGVVEADLELICNSWSVEFLGERLYGFRSHVCCGELTDVRTKAIPK